MGRVILRARALWCEEECRMKMWICIAALIGVLVAITPALAHPKLVRAQPAKGAILKKAPTKIQLWFHEELDTKLSSFRVLNQKNERMDNGDAKVNLDERKLIEGSVRSLPAGTYTVKWKAAGDDDKVVVEGALTFRIRE
jgi:methionine-rich copper-binding protein CopC